MNEQMVKRIKSLAWRMGLMVILFILGHATEVLEQSSASAEIVAFIGLFCGEITKYLNNKYGTPEK